MVICIDFDGTCVTHDYPKIGKDIGAIPVLKKLIESGHKLVLFTMRCDSENGNFLEDAVKWFSANNIELFGININPTQKSWTSSPKAFGELYIDDLALGCPLTFNKELSNNPFVDWSLIELYLTESNII